MSYQFDEDENLAPLATNDAGEQLQSTEATLEQRGSRYGDFDSHSQLSQTLKSAFHDHVVEFGQPEAFTDTINEALDLIFHKLARVANGDPLYDDNFRDIAGYATLVVEHLNKD